MAIIATYTTNPKIDNAVATTAVKTTPVLAIVGCVKDASAVVATALSIFGFVVYVATIAIILFLR